MRTLTFLLVILISLPALGQTFLPSKQKTSTPIGGFSVLDAPLPVGHGSKYWKFTKDAEHHKSVVELVFRSGEADENGIAMYTMGTGTVIRKGKKVGNNGWHEGLILTCYHVVMRVDDKMMNKAEEPKDIQLRKNGVVHFNNERFASYSLEVVAKDYLHDLAIVACHVPHDQVVAEFAEEAAKPNTKIEITGLGGASKLPGLRHFSATLHDFTDEWNLHSNAYLVGGDSGGPVFQKGKLVGMNLAVWLFWATHDVKSYDGNRKVHLGWPARMAGLRPINDLVKELDERPDTSEQPQPLSTTDN